MGSDFDNAGRFSRHAMGSDRFAAGNDGNKRHVGYKQEKRGKAAPGCVRARTR